MWGYQVEMCIYRLSTIAAMAQVHVAMRMNARMRDDKYSIQTTAALTLHDYYS